MEPHSDEVSGFPSASLGVPSVAFADLSSFSQLLYIVLLQVLGPGPLFFSAWTPLGISSGFMASHIIYILIYISSHIFFPEL